MLAAAHKQAAEDIEKSIDQIKEDTYAARLVIEGVISDFNNKFS